MNLSDRLKCEKYGSNWWEHKLFFFWIIHACHLKGLPLTREIENIFKFISASQFSISTLKVQQHCLLQNSFHSQRLNCYLGIVHATISMISIYIRLLWAKVAGLNYATLALSALIGWIILSSPSERLNQAPKIFFWWKNVRFSLVPIIIIKWEQFTFIFIFVPSFQ